MACGCGKKAASGEPARPKTQPVRRVIQQTQRRADSPPMPSADAPRPWRRLLYIVSGPGETETHGTLASAQKRLRDLGPGWSVRAERETS